MSNNLHNLAKSLNTDELVVFLNADDALTVSRNTRGNLNPGYVQSMSVSEAIKFGAWDTTHGTMSAAVSYNGSPVGLIGKRAYAIINTGEQAAWEAEAAEPRETLTCWTYGS